MKKWLSLAALVVLGLALVIGAACGGDGEEEEGVTKLKWGIGIPLTGGYGAAVGVPAEKAFFEDNLATVAGGNASTMKFIHDHHVDFMHQATADPGLCAVSITEEYGMILDTAGINYDELDPNKPHFFQSSATWSLHAPAFFHWLKEARPEVHTIAFVGPDDRTGHAVGDSIVAAAEHFGFDMVVEEYTTPETVEYSHIVTAIYPKDPDIIVTTTIDIYVLLKERGWDGLGVSYYWTDAGPEKVGWGNVEGVILYLPNPIGDHWP
ncbi:MAG: ABC transporter substrate-binding protein, partial [Dehalococcoidia bacterium]|nr:ABC transporter substrate-binding protein [Dehalococcoidia bacterium]